MQRDGTNISLWQSTAKEYQPGISDENKIFDVLVVGGGITGLSTALLLQKAGFTCAVSETKNIGFGTTGGSSAHLNTLMDTPYYDIRKDFGKEEAILVAKAARNAIEQIKRNIEEYQIDCGFQQLSGYLFSQDEEQNEELKKIHDSLVEVGIETDYVDFSPLSIPYSNIISIAAQAQFNPIQYLQGIAAAFENKGGTIFQNRCITGTDTRDGIIYASSDNGDIRAKNIMYATHIPPGVNILHFKCAPYRSYILGVKLKSNQYPDSLVYDMEDPYHYFRTDVTNGEKLLIAGGADHKTGHGDHSAIHFTKLEAYVRKYFDVDEVTYKWSSQYFESADGLPYIGKLPGGKDNMYVATGFGGNGLIYGTVSALILSDLLISGKSEYGKLFNPDRIGSMTGVGNMIKEGEDALGQFIGKWFSTEELETLSSLAKGEGKLVNYEGQKLALYKNEAGKLFALNPTCPHLKCSVNWNDAEKTWDCPCHGSRFSYTGELLTGPSTKNLDVIDLISLDDKK